MNFNIDFNRFKVNEEDKLLKDTTGLTEYKKIDKRNLQTLVKESNSPIVTKDIVQALFIKFSNHRYLINNAYIFPGWEADFLTVTESMYVYEVEVKKTKSDFKEDMLKKEKHLLLESKDTKNNLLRPNRFFYAVPKNMLAIYEIPPYAGLIEVYRNGEALEAVVTKEAPFLHKEDVFSTIKDSLLQKLSWRYRDIMLKDYENAINILTEEEKNLTL